MYNLRVLQFHTPEQRRAEISKIDADPVSLREHLAKGAFRAVKLERVPPLLARFLYQELVLEGGDAVLPPRLDDHSTTETDILLFGTAYQLQHLAIRIRTQSDSVLNVLADHLEQALANTTEARGVMTVRGIPYEWGKRTFVMGIVNVTPDSFSGDGVLAQSAEAFVEQAVAHGVQLAAEGADILDIGGESTRPGSQPTPADEEHRRVIPVIERLRRQVTVPLSVDTYKADVARAALDAGADIVNDVWGLRMDPEMKRLVAARGAPIIIMHNRSKPKDLDQSERLGGRYVGVEYADLLGDIIRELREQVEIGLDAGIRPEQIIIDPGIGFGKTLEHNLAILERLEEFRGLGRPIVLGTSRKKFIGAVLDIPVPEERVDGTAATVALGIERGASVVRVHDVKRMAQVARMTDAIVRASTKQQAPNHK